MKAKLLKKLRKQFTVTYYYGTRQYKVVDTSPDHGETHILYSMREAMYKYRSLLLDYARSCYSKYSKQTRITNSILPDKVLKIILRKNNYDSFNR